MCVYMLGMQVEKRRITKSGYSGAQQGAWSREKLQDSHCACNPTFCPVGDRQALRRCTANLEMMICRLRRRVNERIAVGVGSTPTVRLSYMLSMVYIQGTLWQHTEPSA
jgi:hypothetical protein